MSVQILETFHPVVRSWFRSAFGNPSPPQQLGWPSIAGGNHTLIVAPTGSGKTLAAFLWCINSLVEENIASPPSGEINPGIAVKSTKRRRQPNTKRGVRVLYISPLKALNNDIHRNLEIPLNGILREAERSGAPMEDIRSAVRTGDTTQTERARILKAPPDILITTPESLFLMLSSEKSRSMFHGVRYVIVDEIHSISNSKRGVHLSISLERLEHLIRQHRQPEQPTVPDEQSAFLRIGLSATQRPLETVAQFLGGMRWKNTQLERRPVTIIDAGYKKHVDLKVICAARDFSDMPMDSIWSFILPELLQLIDKHKTTLIFVNNRRLAERIAARLNDMLAGLQDTTNNYAVPLQTGRVSEPVPANAFQSHPKVFAYHGSMSRTVRDQLEADLKSGKLRVLITTSALELGIDIGTVDLVVQIQSPKGIARGLQRVGRSGHLVDAQSKGRLFVTHREDLIESAVVAKGMQEHAIERTVIPQNCLDVAAQQIVAMVGIEEWNVDELYDLLRRSYCYRSLSEIVFHSVLEMLAGRYSTETFRELRARIVWNKLHQQLVSLPGSTLLAVTNAGTIPDKGYFGVYLEDRKTKIGEVDEEFIYESRAGDTFILGTNVWRMTEINPNAVIVAPAPGQPARMPFWRGEGIGRTYELGIRIGEFLEQLSGKSHSERSDFLREFPIDRNSARNIIDYIEEQEQSTETIPTHKHIVIEGFRDEVGDPRIVVHSCFGKGVNGLLGIVLTHVLTERLNTEIQMLYNNDGILFRCSDVERMPLALFSDISVRRAEEIVLDELPSSPLFGALFRQNAARALLLPKGAPGKRTPFFLQRLKSADLLQIVRQYYDFPIVVETIRECLTDVLDFEHFKQVIGDIERGTIRVHTVSRETPSPFAATLLFDFAAVYMYEWDDPKNPHKQQFAQINRDLVGEIVQLELVQRIVRRDAVDAVADQLQFTSLTRRARSPEELMEVFLRLGALTENEIAERVEQTEFFESLLEENIITPVAMGGRKFFILTEEIPLFGSIGTIDADAAAGLPAHLGSRMFEREEALRFSILRMLRTSGPLTAAEIADRFGLSLTECTAILERLKDSDQIIHGSLTEAADEEQWCFRPNMERIYRASISLLRKDIKPASLHDFTRLLLHWQHRLPGEQTEDETGLITVLDQMEGCALHADVWEPEIFRTRIRKYSGNLLRALTQRGEYFYIGAPSGKTIWIKRGSGNFYLEASEERTNKLSNHAEKILHYLHENGASFLSDIREHTTFSLATINHALSELFWSGQITNDIADEAMNVRRYRTTEPTMPADRFEIVNPRRNPLKAAAMKQVRTALKQVPGWNGRWSRVYHPSILGSSAEIEEKIRRQAEQLLVRYGIVAREIAKREEHLLPWPLLAMEFQRMEMQGEIRRGYFVQGLSGMQFATPDAYRLMEEIKTLRSDGDDPIILSACDPANPYGSGLDAGETSNDMPRISRIPGNYIIFVSGIPTVWIENFGARIHYTTGLEIAVKCILCLVDHIRSAYPEKNDIVVEYCNQRRPSETDAAGMLRSAGFYRDKVQTMRIDLR